MLGKTIDQLHVGDTAQFSKTVSETDVYLFAGVSGDFNPAHINEQYASGTFFGKRIAHGLLSASFLSAVLANQLPGPGAIFLSLSVRFQAPVFIGDTITARAEVAQVDSAKHRVTMNLICINQDEKQVLEGEAVLSPPKG
ncbi:MAG: MaoC family dehydratase [Desulfobacterales bacterium]|nr:MaoC family dehydratase [Desulfobacterales bacterium]